MKLTKPPKSRWLKDFASLANLTFARAIKRPVAAFLQLFTSRADPEKTLLIEHADCLLWEATVTLKPGAWHWDFKLHSSAFSQRLMPGHRQAIGNSFWNLFEIPTRTEMDRLSRTAMEEGRPGYLQEFRAKRNGRVYWLHENVSISKLGPNRFWLVGIVTDVTGQHTAELARQTSEERLHNVLRSANCLLWEGEVTLRKHDWAWDFSVLPSGLCEKIYGTPQPSTEQGLWRTFNIPEREEMNRRCRRALEEGHSGFDQVFRIIQPGGEVIWLSETVTIRARGADKYTLVGVVVDITAQRGAEEALATEKERLAVTLRAMSESVVTTDIHGLIQYMNPAAATITGWREFEAAGRPLAEICRLQDNHSDQPVELPVGRMLRSDIVTNLPAHTLLTTRTGNKLRIKGCCAPIHSAKSEVTGAVLVFHDVTEQERLEQELVRATRLESVGVLAGGIAHDFNNILTAIMGNLALAQLETTPDTVARERLNSAEKAALRARDLTQQLLTFAKGGEPVRAAVQLADIIREMTAFALHGSPVKALFDLAPDLWPADVDKGQIGRVVQNLVINAVQAMPQGGTLNIVARNVSLDNLDQPGLVQGDYIQIAITDTGEGIKPEDLQRVFDPYFTTKKAGTGLGLAAVYSIIKKHRGNIEVDSVLGQGASFCLWLPALRDSLALQETSTGPDQCDRLQGRILVMDDESTIRDMAILLLKRFGLSADCAIDGTEAVEKYRAALAAGTPYDLVIIDLTVPGGMGGLAAVAQLREIDPHVRAVVSSGYSSDPVLANYRSHGFCAMVAKPYQVNELFGVLSEQLAAG